VKSSGLAELANLPDTVAGWGLAFLQMRKSVGAYNAMLGVHVSSWTSAFDISYGSPDADLGVEVDVGLAFLNALGLADNVTGDTFDFMVGDPNDRDSGYYELVQFQDRWWDESDSAALDTPSFNRYAEWLRLYNERSGKRWVLWQIPLGNSNHLNVYNNGNPREGYKDNRPEYLLGADGAVNRVAFVKAGVIGLFFGAGTGGMSWYSNDVYTDGQLFMKSRAGSFLN